jgi:hypothetical protein
MKLRDIIEMLELFGFEEAYVRRSLSAGDSAFNAFEALKTSLQLRWGDMCQELSVDEQKRLRPIYDRLMGITMKSRRTAASDRAEAKQRVDSMFQNMEQEARTWKGQSLREAFDFMGECKQRMAQKKAERAAKKKAKRDKKHPDAIDVEYEEK